MAERLQLLNRNLTSYIALLNAFCTNTSQENFTFDSLFPLSYIKEINLPLPVPGSPASRTFISRLPPSSVLFPSPVNKDRLKTHPRHLATQSLRVAVSSFSLALKKLNRRKFHDGWSHRFKDFNF